MTILGRTVTRMNRQTFPSQLRQYHHPWVILPDPYRTLDYVSTGNSDYPHQNTHLWNPNQVLSRLKINLTIVAQDLHLVLANMALSQG